MRFSPPDIHPLSRLQVSKGLLITTERWQHAQTYHRQRQNLHYQSLHQPGIVRGFGVRAIPTPAKAQGKERGHWWVRISPGIAIDLKGNPIILESAWELGLDPSTLDRNQGPLQTLYLVVQHFDPEQPKDVEFPDSLRSDALDPLPDQVKEGCRFIQRSRSELQPEDVELCRVQVELDRLQIQNPVSVYEPGHNALDFRHRLTVRLRAEAVVKVAQFFSDPDAAAAVQASLQTLLQASAGLFPALQGDRQLQALSQGQLNAPPPVRQMTDPVLEQLTGYQLAYLPYALLATLSPTGRDRLRCYLAQGGVLLIGAAFETQPLEAVRQKLAGALSDLETNQALGDETDAELKTELAIRLSRVSDRLNQTINEIGNQVKTFADRINYPLTGEGRIDSDHPLRTVPFSFSRWPTLNSRSLQVYCWDGIVLVVGNLTELWESDKTLQCPRSDIRTAQEWGVNVLHYAWRHHHLTQLQVVDVQP